MLFYKIAIFPFENSAQYLNVHFDPALWTGCCEFSVSENNTVITDVLPLRQWSSCGTSEGIFWSLWVELTLCGITYRGNQIPIDCRFDILTFREKGLFSLLRKRPLSDWNQLIHQWRHVKIIDLNCYDMFWFSHIRIITLINVKSI